MSSQRHRILAGAGALFLFGALFALPLVAAMSLCTMPCCHHNRAAGVPVLALDMTGCWPHCSVRTEDVAPATVRTAAAPGGTMMSFAPASTPVALVSQAHATIALDTGPPPSAAAPVHILNSVFRI